MRKILSFTMLVCMLSAANAWGAVFLDNFNRPNGTVGNGWSTQVDGTIKVEIVDKEVLIAGTEATAWARAGISRPMAGETRVAFDFKADDVFNVHIRVDSVGSAYVEVYAWAGGNFSYASSPDGAWPGWVAIDGSNMTAGEYNTLVLDQNGTEFTVTLNGTKVGTVTNAGFTRSERVLIASDADAGQAGSLHIDNVQIGVEIPGVAKNPSPVHSGTDVPRDVVLGWAAGVFADTHNVYLGTSFADVNTAGVAQAVGKGQAETTFAPASLLQYGTTYYWRVDEVNAPPSTTVFKGDVWSFTVEPYTYPVSNIIATASSSDKATTGPEKTVNGSGLNASDLHSTASTDMWLSKAGGPQPTWIQYQFDRAYGLSEMWVWNYNMEFEPVLGYGLKDVTIEYSLDGTNWTKLSDVQFAQATAQAGYAHNTVVDLGGIVAQYIRLTANSNWSPVGLKQYGLSEVRFFYMPVQAREPQPAVGAKGVALDTQLSWRPGRKAASHKVYFSQDEQAVADGTALVDTMAGHSYQPAALEFGKTYSWRVDEVNEASSWTGDVWSFSTTEFTPVDDFESYNDVEGQGTRIYETWIDGYADASSGSTVGNLTPPFAEQGIVHGGLQSMPMDYNNTNAPYYSEAERAFDTPQDWTISGANTLSLWVKGNAPRFVETAPGQYNVSSNSADVWGNSDNFRFVYKQLAGDGSISAKVIAITDTTSTWAKAGVMIRNTLDPDSTYAFMFPTPDGRRAFQNRPLTAGNAVSAHSNPGVISFPLWVKLERKGKQFTASYSTDGKTWTVQPATENTGGDSSPNPQSITMGSAVYIGLAVTSNNAAAGPCIGQFSDVVTTGSVSGQWVAADIGPNPANDPASLYVTVEDKAGKKKTVTHPNPAATTFSNWTEWQIAFTDLTGVNLTAVKKLVIGVGDRANPQRDGSGKLYIDDIGVGRPAAK